MLIGSIYKFSNWNETDFLKHNNRLNKLLAELKSLLQPIQQEKQEMFDSPEWPVGMIVGNPRSGSTLLLQWLANLGVFSYPTNFLTRFAYAPYLGALIQKMLFDPEYDFMGEFKDIQSEVNYDSSLGKSKGALATNEFQHFLRNYVPSFDPVQLGEKDLQNVDALGMRKALASIEQAFRKPFFTKGVMLQFNIEHFYENIPELFFVMIKREPIFIMQSLLYSREQYYGDRNRWWSVKPYEYCFLKDMDIYHQIAGQVYFTEKAIHNGLEKVPEDRKLIINYEEFCASPNTLYEDIVKKYRNLGYAITKSYNGPESFSINNEYKLPAFELEKLASAYEAFCENKA